MPGSYDVVCFGEILWDIFEAEPRAGQPIARAFRAELGGSPANVAAGVARLGLRSAIVGAVGRDRLGQGLKRLLESEHVATDFVVELPNRTGLTFVIRDAEGEPEFLFYRHASADLAITAEHMTPAMGQARWGLVGTSTLVTPSLAEATRHFLDSVRINDGLLFVDLNVRPHLWADREVMRTAIANLLKDASVVKASEPDLEALAGPHGLPWLQEHASGATWILTRGAKGAEAIGAHGDITVPAASVRAIDATGAGDAFVAGVLAVLVESGTRPGDHRWKDAELWTRALEAGHMMGAKAVRSVGAVTGLTDLQAVRATIELTSTPGLASDSGT
jgi:fructokinase